MKAHKCPQCGRKTERVWTSKDGSTVGMRCTSGHRKAVANKGKPWLREYNTDYPVYLVAAKGGEIIE